MWEMSQKRNKHEIPGTRPNKANGGKKTVKKGNAEGSNHKEKIIRKLFDTFQDNFDLALIISVAHTCQWDINRATEALMILGGRKDLKKNKNKNSKGNRKEGTKAKSLPGTLKQDKSSNGKGMGLNNPIHHSTNSLSSGQVWQRHYKSKPQSPGLLTMIPPNSKEVVKLKKSDSSGRSTPKSGSQSGDPKKSSAIVARIQQLVQNGVKVMILMRGAPGSGKTHLAQVIVSLVTRNELSQHILSTDDYFIMLGRGNYAYDFNQLGQAHNWNQKRVSEALKRGINPVVVDNTNIQAWEMHPYVYLAVENGYLVEVLEPVTPWRTKEAELARRNLHSVPREKIRQMLERYEPGWTGEKLIQSLGLKYKHGGSRATQEKRRPPPPATNSLLAQHRQHALIDVPEKPKRKKNGGKKKDRHALAGIEITEDREKQLEELNKLFAEYGKKMDPVSRKKVLESGVPISEVVSRMRKLQGNILPLPRSNVPTTTPSTTTTTATAAAVAAAAAASAVVPTTTTTVTTAPEPERKPKPLTETNVIKPVPNYSGTRVDSFSESFEPDTMSSSNASETSECETDTDAELPKWQEMRRYFEYGSPGHFVDGEDLFEDYDEDEERRPRSEGAIGGRKISKSHLTSSQEELSLIDFGTSVTQSSYSQDDLSLLNYDGTESADAKDSSSSSEEQETQMLTLQESLREALTKDTSNRSDEVSEESAGETGKGSGSGSSKPIEVELSESLINAFNKRFESTDREYPQSGGVSFNESLLQMLVKKYSNEEDENVKVSVTESKKSPDLEEVPLPSIPSESKGSQPTKEGSDWCGSKRDRFEDIVKSWEHPPEAVPKGDSAPKQARLLTTHSGAIKKTGIQRDKSPEEILKSAELSWSSISFTSSWDDVSKKAAEMESHAGPKPQRKATHKSDSSTNTIHTDFDLWKKDGDGIVKLNTRSRNINQNYKEPVIPSWGPVTDKLMLDKSSMTLDVEDVEVVARDSAVDTLAGMFPGISIEHLSYILEKCHGNILWAIELLLESPQGFESLPNASGEDKPPSYSEAKAACESEAASLQNMIISDGKKTIKRRKDKKNSTSELSLLLKKQIEDSIHINEDLYQDKTLFLKKLRHGKIEFGDEPIEPAPEYITGNMVTEAEGIAARGPEITDEEDKEDDEEEEEEEETIPMKIDAEFFKLLSKQFGASSAAENEKQASLVSVINVPLSLAQQIYDCWLENVNRKLEEMQTDYDRMIKEDELLAGALQEQEFEFKQPDLREIMDMELAMLLYKQDQAQSSGTNRETLATKLSKQLLFETYPNLDKKMILDLFESEGNSFRRTVEILSARENESPATVIAPEFLTAHGNKLFEQVKSESLKKNVEKTRTPILIVKQTSTKKESSEPRNVLVVNPAEYRQKAVLLHQQRNECCRLAQEAFRKKSYSVASYFSHIASLYKERIKELKKEPFSSTLFEDKANRMHTQVDLHFLYVSEALQMVDLFLDHHIKELRKKSSTEALNLSLITGRGRHSALGKSKIKPAVKKRLQERLLSFAEPNPGMLKVTVRKNDLLSDEQ